MLWLGRGEGGGGEEWAGREGSASPRRKRREETRKPHFHGFPESARVLFFSSLLQACRHAPPSLHPLPRPPCPSNGGIPNGGIPHRATPIPPYSGPRERTGKCPRTRVGGKCVWRSSSPQRTCSVCIRAYGCIQPYTRAPPLPPPPLSLVLSLISTPLFLSVRAAVPERQGRRVCPGGWAPRAVRRRFEPHGPQRPRLVLAVPRYFAHSPAKGRSRLVFQFRQLQRRTREQEGCL